MPCTDLNLEYLIILDYIEVHPITVYFTSTYHNFNILFILLLTLLSHNSYLVAQTAQAPENEHPPTAMLSKVKTIVGTCKVNRIVWQVLIHLLLLLCLQHITII